MKRYESDDELERALFNLELEEPPADLRSAILAATIYRQVQPSAVRPWEVWAFGILCAVLTWVLVLIARGTAAPASVSIASYADEAVRLFSQPQTLFWIAVGGGAAMWFSQLNLIVAPGASRATRR
jgi:hypothetical protein